MLDSIQLDPIAFTIPIGDGFPIYWYGIIVTMGIAIGAIWAGREIQKRGYSVDELYNGLILVIIAGYAFARLTYVLLDVIGGAQYGSFIDVINIRAGGVNILGGFIGAALGWLDMGQVARPAVLGICRCCRTRIAYCAGNRPVGKFY